MRDPKDSSLLSRRHFGILAPSFALTTAVFPNVSWAQIGDEDIKDMKPGQFIWKPELSPSGPVVVIVSLPDQRVHVYRNAVRIGVSTCSTGKRGHRTPTGVFTILQKHRKHFSSTYNNAPMPNMQRLTWSGIALHAGRLPGYPASHGCVRLPRKFSRLVFSVTHLGSPVIIADDHHAPATVTHPGMILSNQANNKMQEAFTKLRRKKLPGHDHKKNEVPPTTVLVSSKDKQAWLIVNGEVVARGSVTIKDPDRPLGTHTFVLKGADDTDNHLHWVGLGHTHHDKHDLVTAELSVLKRIAGSPSIVSSIQNYIHPGMTFVVTDLGAHAETRSKKDFVIMTTS